MIDPLVIYFLTLLLSAGSGFFISYRFNKSTYAATNKSGDFGTPRGGFFALMSGMLIGALAVNLTSRFSFFPAEAIGTAFMIALIAGALAGVVGMLMAVKARNTNDDDNGEGQE